MANSFHRTMRSLQRDTGLSSTLSGAIAVALLSAWLVWAFQAHVTRYETSDTARLEVDAAAHPVQSSAAGIVVSSSLVLGRMVQAGEILAELDSANERFTLDEERARYSNLQPQLASLDAQINAERAAEEADHGVTDSSSATALAQYKQANIEATLAEAQAARAHQMRAEGILAPAEAERTEAEAHAKRANADSLKAAAARLTPELAVKQREREAKIREIAAAKAKLASDLSVSAAVIQRLESQRERRLVRAPIAGRLAECATLPPGSHITEGQQLGVILPSSGLQIVADFQPAAAFGKIRPGQNATLRLEGFPWAQFGMVTARVTAVASEISNGKVRVELAVTHAPKITLQHGLPGVVEVEVERTTPAAMLLRSAGTLAGAR